MLYAGVHCLCLFISQLIFSFILVSNRIRLTTKHKFISFFYGLAILKPPTKAVAWAGKAKALLPAFGLSVGPCGLANVLTTVSKIRQVILIK
ncbi:hypothetical protein DDZ16_19875 [Marinilabilia rubra]|uniref:Uncharacterized protein n=1 Tax=Marinilabilia rubra TaxID=2162893 RepID=A0A2U2B3G0_9BACT|nr:hypothetical protein DDZ16_19875 [Marinilabilia rubra]